MEKHVRNIKTELVVAMVFPPFSWSRKQGKLTVPIFHQTETLSSLKQNNHKLTRYMSYECLSL